MKILISGAKGFLGTHISREMEHHEIVGIDIKNDPHLEDLRDERNAGRIFAEHSDADVCIHLAAKVGRAFGEDNPIETVLDNIGMTALVARACGQHGIRLVYASTSEVYGDNGDTEVDEYDGPFRLPANLYGITKGDAEHVCQLYAPDGLTILRFSMPYGPGLPAGRGRAAIINMLHQALHGKPIPVHCDAERSWCWVGDTARAVRMIVEDAGEGVFNVGRDDNAVSMLLVAQIAINLVGADGAELIELVEAPANQTVVKRLSTKRLRALGWEPEVSLGDGMEMTLPWVESLDEEGNPRDLELERI